MIEGFNELEDDIMTLKLVCLNEDGSIKNRGLGDITRAFAQVGRTLKELEIQTRFNIAKEGED